jgi:DNA-binding transcriptional regulator YhcF (GntR family)
MDNGWIKLHRKLLDNPIHLKPTWFSVWVHLLLLANHEDKEFIWNGKKQTITTGQFLTGRKELAKKCGVSPSLIERVLNYLEIEQQIRQQKTTKYRVITILNWNVYQKIDSKSDNKRTTNGQQADTNKKYKNEKNDKNNTILATDVARKSKFNPLGAEILHAFEGVDPKNKTYYGNTTQRSACDYLLETYGLEEVLKRITVLPKTNRVPFFPKINSPNDLKEKWVKLQDAVEAKRAEIKNNNKIAF